MVISPWGCYDIYDMDDHQSRSSHGIVSWANLDQNYVTSHGLRGSVMGIAVQKDRKNICGIVAIAIVILEIRVHT